MTINTATEEYYSYQSTNMNDIHVDVSADQSTSTAHSDHASTEIELILEDSLLRKKLANGEKFASY